MTYEEKPADGSYDVYFGIEWNESNVDGGTFTITPKIYRWDRYDTNNSGGRWSEDITEPGGSTGSWSNLQFGSGSGYRVIDTFGKRTYSKAHSAGTIYYHLYTDANFGTYSNGFYTLGAQTWTFLMTIPARASYKVTLNANGGSGGTASLTKWYGESLSLTSGVTNPTRSGYTFAGWYENSSGTGSKITSYTGNAAKTYYAKWTPNTYTMTYKANGGSGSDQTQTKTHAVDATVKAASTFSRTGYTFASWNTKADGTGTTYSAGSKYTTNAAVTLYAIWTINTWTVSYNGNNATGGSTASQTKTYNKALTLRTNGFTRTNYSFVNWNTASNGSGTSYAAGGTLPANVNNTVTLYAQWSLDHANPSIGTFTVKRCDANGTLNVQGRCMLAQASWTCDSSATGSGTAVVSANGVNDTITFTGASGSISTRIHQNSGGTKTDFPIDHTYKVTLTVTDSAGYSSSKITTLSVAFFTMHFRDGGNGVGIGSPSLTAGMLDIGLIPRLIPNSDGWSAIRFKNPSADIGYAGINFFADSSTNGDAMLVGCGGMTVVGSGESHTSWYNRVIGSSDPRFKNSTPGTETLWLTSDNNVVLISNANTVGNRKAIVMNNSGNFVFSEDTADVSSATNGVSANTYRSFGALDVNDQYYFFCEGGVKTDGSTVATLAARNYGTGAAVNNAVNLTVANDGTRSVSFTESAPWRTALGLGDTPTSVTTITSVITVNSTNATISSVNYKQWGKVASVKIAWTNKSAISVPASGNITNFDIGTIVSGKRPANDRVTWTTDGDNAGAAFGGISSGGVMNLGGCEGTGAARTIAAGSTFISYAAYVVA